MGNGLTIRQYLNSYGELKLEVRRLRLKSESLRSRATNTTKPLSDMPKGGGGDQDAVLVSLADITVEYDRMLVDAEKRALEIEKLISKVESPVERIILRQRYLELKRWSRVLDSLWDAGYEYQQRQMYEYHGRALRSAQKIYEEEHDEQNGCT